MVKDFTDQLKEQKATIVELEKQLTTRKDQVLRLEGAIEALNMTCLLYTSPSPRDKTVSRMPSSA